MNRIRLSRTKIVPFVLRHPIRCTTTALWPRRPAYAQGGDPGITRSMSSRRPSPGPIATGLSLVAIVIGGLMFAFGEGQSEKVFAGIVFGDRHGRGRGEFHGVAVSAVNRHAYEPGLQGDESSINDSGSGAALCFSSLCFRGLESFNLVHSLAGGILLFFVGLIAAQRATKFDPEILRIPLNSAKFKSRYDPMKWEPLDVRIKSNV